VTHLVANRWAYVPALLLAAMLLGLLTLARIAGDDPGFAVERDYYQKASNWNAEMAQQAENERLGWQPELAVERLSSGRLGLDLRLRDRSGVPVRDARVSVEAFPNARSAERLTLLLAPRGDGYTAELPSRSGGVWEFRLSVQAGSHRFTSVLRRELEVRP
jgi:nitrogen fixation protein FixH